MKIETFRYNTLTLHLNLSIPRHSLFSVLIKFYFSYFKGVVLFRVMDKVIDRLSPNQLGSLSEALQSTKSLNQAIESCPFGHVRKKKICLSNNTYYAKFEQRAAIKAGWF